MPSPSMKTLPAGKSFLIPLAVLFFVGWCLTGPGPRPTPSERTRTPNPMSYEQPPGSNRETKNVGTDFVPSDNADTLACSTFTVDWAIRQLDEPEPIRDRQALRATMAMLRCGHIQLAEVASYTTAMARQERVGGTLLAHEDIEVKVRHKPFGVYMKWLSGDTGREALYVEDEYDERLLVRLGGLKGRFLPTLRLDPHGSRAMAHSRYPIMSTGLLELCDQLIGYRTADLEEEKTLSSCFLEASICDERDSFYFELEYALPQQSPTYRKTRLHIDRSSLLPVCIWNYTWSEDVSQQLDDDTLIEHYHFTDIQLDAQLADIDFDRANPGYRLR